MPPRAHRLFGADPACRPPFGPESDGLACAVLGALLLALIGWTQDLTAWFPLRFLVGVVIGPLYVISEVWIIALAPPERRGRVIGLYTTVISAGFAAGPLSLILVGSQGWPPFLVGISAFVACALFLAAVVPRLPHSTTAGKTLRSEASCRTRPSCSSPSSSRRRRAGDFVAIADLRPRPRARRPTMSALLAVLVAGNIALQVPLGLAAERWAPRPVLIACAAGTALGSFVLPFVIDTSVWAFVFVWGAISYGIYTLALIELGERFSGSMLVAGNAAFALMWGVGGLPHRRRPAPSWTWWAPRACR